MTKRKYVPRRRKRTYKRKRIYKRRQRGGIGPYVSKPFGNKLRVVTRYVENQITINPGAAGIMDEFVFSANGLYDPNITGVGHQPIGFDQYMTMFDHYTVIGAKIICTFVNTDTATSQQVGIYVKDAPSTETDIRKYIENGLCKYKTISPTTYGNNQCTIVYPLSIPKFFTKKKIIGESDYKGSVAANPTEQAYFHCFAAPIQSTDPTAVQLFVLIEYIAILTEPKTLALS